ncbi:MAG: Hsp20/alpha crystallin family protein [Flavobacteriales bacterium]|nr:Hsp20/alpha crystallin family protein [Flavobacteriales bacterium]
MNLVRFNPRRTRNTINPFFDEFFKTDYRNVDYCTTNQPAVNITDENESYFIDIAAPGFDKKDFKISIEDNQLKVSAEIESESEETTTEQKFTKREFRTSSFERSFSLPETTKQDEIKADYKVGVLHIEIPKQEVEKPTPARLVSIG